MSVFKQIRATRPVLEVVPLADRAAVPSMVTARVISVGMATGDPEGDPVMPVELQISAPETEPYVVVTSLVVPVGHAHEVAPGAGLRAWVETGDPEGLVVDWGD